LSLPTVPPAKRTKCPSGKTPEEVSHPDNSDAPANPDDKGLDENCQTSKMMKIHITRLMKAMNQVLMSVMTLTMILVRSLMKRS